jgi:tetratricopeptide (TPR) repeat protein
MRISRSWACIPACLALASAVASGEEIQPLMEAGNAAYLRGDYETARQSYAKAWDIAEQLPPKEPVRYDVLKRLASVRSAAGEFADADMYLQMAINWRENAFGLSDARVADDLVISAGFSRALKNYDRALLILNRVMAIHRLAGGPTAIADDFSRMAQIYLEQKKLEDAIAVLKTAIELRQAALGPLDASLVRDLDRLASVYVTQREYANSEAAYRHALVIRETLEGKDDPDLIATVDGLAYSCFGQKRYEDAERLYDRLIALWIKSLGDDHPMLALALDKVAVFYADQKKYDEAKEAQDRANAIRSHFLATGLSTAAAEQVAEGNKTDAIALYRRAAGILDPPNPVYDEFRGDIGRLIKELQAPAAKPGPKRAGAKKQ